MYGLMIVLVSVLPGVFWVWFFYRQDRADPEPVGWIVVTFFIGMLATIPAALLETPFRSLLTEDKFWLLQLVVSVCVVGLAEEACKLLATYGAVRRNPAFNEPRDAIIYGVTASLGFAALENLLYVIAYGVEVAPVRAIVTTLAHASFGGISGYYLGIVIFFDNVSKYRVLQGLGMAAGLHGIYNFFVMAGWMQPFISLGIVYGSYRYVAWKIKTIPER